MDRRRSRTRNDASSRSQRAGDRTSRGRSRQQAGSGLGPTFFIMAGVVLAILVGGFLLAGPIFRDEPEPTANTEGPTTIVVDPRDNREPQPPWSGTIAGRKVVVKHGMSPSDIRNQLGDPTTTHEYSAKDELILIYKDDTDRADVFTARGGRQLRVVFDQQTGKLVHYDAPDEPQPTSE